MRRREFLTQSSQAAVALSLTPLAACAARHTRSAPSGSRDAVSVDRLAAHLDDQIPRWMRDGNVPGVSIVIIRDAKIAWRRAFGVTDAASKVQANDDTMFEAASMSKPVFAYVVMKLCETGLIGLDTPLTSYTSNRFLEGDQRLDVITARHVLSHTSGFQNWRSEQQPLSIHFTPGEKFLYSGEGYNYLQTVVTSLLHQPFETYMKERLLVPFGMNS